MANRSQLAMLVVTVITSFAGWVPAATAQQQVIFIPPPIQCAPGDKIIMGQCYTPEVIQPAFSAVAVHADASDVWIAAMYPDAYSAKVAAKARCDAEMKGGCDVNWQGQGYIGVARGADGSVVYAIDRDKSAVNKSLAEHCKAYELGCTLIGTFKSRDEFRKGPRRGDNIREPKDPALLHKKYAAASWVNGEGYDGMYWIASGYDTYEKASKVALNLCKMKRNESPGCQVVTVSGNGVILAFTSPDKNSFIVEQDEARAKKAMAAKCKREKRVCTVKAVYDARTADAFESNFE